MSWEKVKLVELCIMNSGGTPRRGNDHYYGGDIPWAKIGDIENSKQGYITSTVENITKEGLKSIGNKIFPKGTLLLALYGSVGKTAFAGVELSTNQAILGIKIKDEKKLDRRYLKYWFEVTKEILLNRAVGGTLQNISLGIVKNLEIPLPPLEVQKQIADTLDKADELRKKDELLLKKYDELAQSIFYDMFGDPVENEKGWEKKKLKLCVDGKYGIKAGPFGSSLKKEFYVDSGYKIYGQEQVIADDLEIGNYYIDETRYRSLETCKVQSGDVLISLVGTYGKVAVVPEVFEEGIINPRLVKITFNQKIYNPYFFKYLFATSGTKESLKGVTRGGTMDIINGGILKELELIVPPIIVQNDFIRKIDYTKKCKELILKADSNRLFDCLLNQYFS